jgi:hypothetical protein
MAICKMDASWWEGVSAKLPITIGWRWRLKMIACTLAQKSCLCGSRSLEKVQVTEHMTDGFDSLFTVANDILFTIKG